MVNGEWTRCFMCLSQNEQLLCLSIFVYISIYCFLFVNMIYYYFHIDVWYIYIKWEQNVCMHSMGNRFFVSCELTFQQMLYTYQFRLKDCQTAMQLYSMPPIQECNHIQVLVSGLSLTHGKTTTKIYVIHRFSFIVLFENNFFIFGNCFSRMSGNKTQIFVIIDRISYIYIYE